MTRFTTSLVLLATLAIRPAGADEWQQLKDPLIQTGITPSVTYDGGVTTNAAGGIKTGTAYTGNLHLQLALDGKKLASLGGLSAWLDGLWINAGNPDKFVGDFQGVNNITAAPALRPYEAWLQYNFPGSRFSALAGLYDLSSEFYRLTSAGLFLNGSFGTGPEFGLSGLAGPSIYPATALGVRLAYKPTPNTVLRVAVMDGAPLFPQDGSPDPFNPKAGLLLVGEAAFLTRPPADDPPNSRARHRIGRLNTLRPYDDKVAIGAWYYTAKFDDLSATAPDGSPVQHHGEGGAYLLADHLLFQSPDNPKRRLAAFAQVGVGQQAVDRTSLYVAAGLVANGFFPGRPDDELGLAVAMARNGSHYLAAQQQAGLPVDPAETAIELSYLAQVASWLAVQPDVQYVINPNTDPRQRDATVLQLLLEASF